MKTIVVRKTDNTSYKEGIDQVDFRENSRFSVAVALRKEPSDLTNPWDRKSYWW